MIWIGFIVFVFIWFLFLVFIKLEFILFLVAIVLFAILGPLGFVWYLVKILFNFKLFFRVKSLKIYFKSLAISIDQLANVVCKEFFNDILISGKNSYKFGNPDETISGVIGKNKRLGTLTNLGFMLSYVLDKLDENHSENSIEEDENH